MLLPGAVPAKPAPGRIVAIGDLHGDYDAWQAIARAAGLVDAKGRWTGGKRCSSRLGDVVDRGPDSLKIIRQLMRLQREAPQARRTRSIVLVGNHEAMNMTDDLRYVHPGRICSVRRPRLRRRGGIASMRRTGRDRSRLRARDPEHDARSDPRGMDEGDAARQARTSGGVACRTANSADGCIGNPAVVKLGDTLFVHGGISAAYAQLSIDEINRRVADALKAQDETPTVDHQRSAWARSGIAA